jgi:quinohemoprotein ethanol dehydrogenase
MMNRLQLAGAGIAIAAVLAACATTSRDVTDRQIADESRTADWLAYGRTHSETRFSPLRDVDVDTVARLGVDWYLDLPDAVGLTGTPLVVDGVLYFSGGMNVVRAVDAVSGELLWSYDPQVAREVAGYRQAGWVHNRGLSYYGDTLLASTWDGRLLALDAATGALRWSTRTFPLGEPLYITGAPKAFKGKVLIGNGGTEAGPSRGYVTAYDVATGEQAWRFYIVPGNPADGFESEAMEMAAATWNGNWWEHGGGGNAWHGFTYDPELDTLYIGTGNGSPWNRDVRSPGGGDNLFLCSIVALDPDTGEYRWHYQTTPGETWDYNSNMDIVLSDLEIEGRTVKALMHAPKNGFFYVIDRETGKLVSAEPFAETNWATHVDLETGRPVETPWARYPDGPQVITPTLFGAHNWPPMSYNPVTGLVYLPTIHHAVEFDPADYDTGWRAERFAGGTAVDWVEDVKQPRDYPGSLQAWDPVAQKSVWTVPQQQMVNAGTLTTAGNLVFQGRADGVFLAYDARSGDVLWEMDLGLGISAPPITYRIAGRQYIALLVGYGGGAAAKIGNVDPALGWAYGRQMRRLVVFALDGDTRLPPQPPPHRTRPLVVEDFGIDADLVAEGETQWVTGCHGCHGRDVIAAGMAPDLRESPVPLDADSFAAVVRDGVRAERAMPAHGHLDDRELLALRHYIRQQAHATADGVR